MEAGQEALLHHFLVILVAVVGERLDGDAATGIEQADDFQILGIHQLDQVLHDDVHAVLVEVAVVTEAEEIEFEALTLHHQCARDIINNNVSEVGLSRLGAQRGKLWTIQGYQIFILRMLILEGLQHLWSIVITILGILVSQQGYAF